MENGTVIPTRLRRSRRLKLTGKRLRLTHGIC
nr:MAG TPA: hypothetical protein [Caudoviricetes sp.]